MTFTRLDATEQEQVTAQAALVDALNGIPGVFGRVSPKEFIERMDAMHAAGDLPFDLSGLDLRFDGKKKCFWAVCAGYPNFMAKIRKFDLHTEDPEFRIAWFINIQPETISPYYIVMREEGGKWKPTYHNH